MTTTTLPPECRHDIDRRAAYDGEDDFAKSILVAFETVRERVARGGPGWTPGATLTAFSQSRNLLAEQNQHSAAFLRERRLKSE
jgi:hypothetical protein